MKDSQRKAIHAKRTRPSQAHINVPIKERLIPMENMKDWVKHYKTDHDDDNTDSIFSTHKGIPTTDYFDENGKKLNVSSPSWNTEGQDAHRIKYFRLNQHGHKKIAFLAEPETIQARKHWKQFKESNKK